VVIERHNKCLYYLDLLLECPSTLPTLTNGDVIYENGGGPYVNGFVLEYECNANFSSSNTSLYCVCNAINATAAEWDCEVNFSIACQRSEHQLL